MAFLSEKEKSLFFEIRQKIGSKSDLDGSEKALTPGIYQMRHTDRGRVPIRMKFYEPTNPQTAEQQAWRSEFAQAVNAWQNLSNNEKDSWNKKASGRSLSGYNLFISNYLKNV